MEYLWRWCYRYGIKWLFPTRSYWSCNLSTFSFNSPDISIKGLCIHRISKPLQLIHQMTWHFCICQQIGTPYSSHPTNEWLSSVTSSLLQFKTTYISFAFPLEIASFAYNNRHHQYVTNFHTINQTISFLTIVATLYSLAVYETMSHIICFSQWYILLFEIP